ncbi:MAG: zinc-ribbon domain containing protein [Candidatus Gastranaerophilales bacterium]|nr:zinc-ribbon domain containing protein [Candidatus Gastranaerophilales bacterium]
MTYQFEDQTLECADCGASFTFSAEDQEFFAQKGFSQPRRCPSCRAAKKAASRGGSYGGGGGRSGGRSYDKPQYRVTCSACGCETTVPFEPKGDRPVYCSDCYRNM